MPVEQGVSHSRLIASHVAKATLHQYSARSIQLGKNLILDTVGNAIGGSVTSAGRLLIEYGDELAGGPPQASVVTRAVKLPAKDAAFVNAHLAALLDFDEAYHNAGHPGSPIVHAALAAGERVEASGERLLAAVITAYDVTTRLIDAINPSLERWHARLYPIGTTDAFGPAIAAAVVMGHDEEKTYHTISLGGANARLPIEGKNSDPPKGFVKNSQGWSAHNGIVAAVLAGKGFTGVTDILDGDHAFPAAAGSDRWRPALLFEGLGERCNIDDISFKAQPVARWIHPSIEGAVAAIEENGISVDDIDEIVVHSHTNTSQGIYADQDPQTMVSAQFSIPFGIAAALLRIPPGPKWYDPAVTNNANVQGLAAKVKVFPDPEADSYFAASTLHTLAKVTVYAGGQGFQKRIEYAKGDPIRPMSDAELRDKFRVMVDGIIPQDQCEQIIGAIDRLESIDACEGLARVLRSEA